jgi:nucleotide-binding universal stress UspA family protein
MIKTIIVPTDGSDHATKAIDLAADLGGKYGARVIVLHVLLSDASPTQLKTLTAGLEIPQEVRNELDRLEELPLQTAEFAGAYAPVTIPVPLEVLQPIGKAIAERARAMVQSKGVGKVDIQIVGGRAADSILAAAEHEKADMIIMGSRGMGDLKGLFVGSVSNKVSHLAPCTCITVK